MQICSRHNWKLEDDWFKMSPYEQEAWIDYERDRIEQIGKMKDALTNKKVLTDSGYTLLRLLGDLV